MESIQQNYNDNFMEHMSNGPPDSPDISNIVGDPQLHPRVGEEYQVEVPSMVKESEQLLLLVNPFDSEAIQDKSLSFAIGLPISVTWMYNEVEDSRLEGLGYLAEIDGTVNETELAQATNVIRTSISDNEEELKPNAFRSVITGDKNSGQMGKRIDYLLAPCTLSNSWSEADAKNFLLGLYIFGKNFIQIKKFLGNKGIGEILSFYYGKFYKSDEYRRWSDCRKIKGRKCRIGQKLFTGQRQQGLLSRLMPHVSEESQDTLLQVSKSYVEGRASLEEYVSSLKSTVGLGVLVEAVGIGKEKEDLTSLAVELGKNNRVLSAPTSKDWSSLEPTDIIKLLTGGFRLSKAKSNDLFWEAVWPRLLARGWHSEQPKNQGYVTSKDYLVFLIPGVKKFSRKKLVKGDHYFDSVSDILSKVVAEPNLLELDEEAKVGSCNDEEPERKLNKDDQSNYHRQCYLKPRASTTDRIKFMVIDTSLVPGGKSSDLMKFKSLPVNSAGKVELKAAGIPNNGAKHLKKVNHSKKMSKSIDRKLTKFTVIDTSVLYDGKLLKVRKLRYLPVELENASELTALSRASKDRSADEDSPSVVEANMLTCDKKNTSNTDSQKGIFDSNTTKQKEKNDNPDNDANKMVESQKSQKPHVSDDNQQLKRTIKHQFSRRVRSGHSNQALLPIKRRRLTACAKSETSRIIENSLGGLGSEKSALPQSSSFPDAHENVCNPVSHQQNESLTASPTDRIVEENNEKCIRYEIYHCMNISCVKVEKCESKSPVTFNKSPVSSKAENGETMPMVQEDGCLKANVPCLSTDTREATEKPLRTSCDVDSVEQQPNINPRRQSARNRPLTVKALESLENEFLCVQRRQKRKDILPNKDAFNPCRKARTKGKTMLHRHSSDHGTAGLVEEKHLNGDCRVSEIFSSH